MKSTNINLGRIKRTQDDLVVNLEDLSFCMLIGGSASGKTYWINNIYEQLNSQLVPRELGYVLISVGYEQLEVDESYLLEPASEPTDKNFKHPIETLRDYAELANLRAQGKKQKNKHIIVHIEKSDLAYAPEGSYFKSINVLSKNAKRANMSLVLIDNRANKYLTPPEMISQASLIALFSSDNYIENSKNLAAVMSFLDKFEKQIILGDETYIIEALYK